MRNINNLHQKWFEKLQKGDTISITDLYPFSRVRLKRSRMRKKFRKYYHRYISEEIQDTYWGILMSYPLVKTFKKQLEFNLDIVPMDDTLPKGELVYLDFNYQE